MTDPGANSAPFRIEYVAETGSTNADVLARASAGEPAGLVLVADHQTAGRGRLDRRWQAPPGASLLMSVLFRPRGPAGLWHRCLTAVAVAACDACASFGVVARIKWPNDLVVGDDKLAGILAETDGKGAVIVGLGCNIDWPRAGEYPGATSFVACGATVRRDAVLRATLDRVEVDAPDLHDRYVARSATIGTDVRVELPGGDSVEGRAVDVDDGGRLVVLDRDNRRAAYSVGDVIHLR
ncbi:MAG TPA: biotin--[acetyl-CoA-carboxylase] ligase [Acidimicrobiales bacterium]|nr:biotin--[acetyl-CoA-carboxylase] ligase [Acidimicrobiales bacterium]